MMRRAFIQAGAVVAAGSFLPDFARRALAQTEEPALPATGGARRAEHPKDGRRKVLVFLFLRGALDGLHAVAPVGEKRLYELRPQLAEKPEEMLPLEPGFALHRSLQALLPLWHDEALAVVHAVGSPDPTRSHFDAQDFLELGTPGVKGTPDGWLARSLRQQHSRPFEMQHKILGKPGGLSRRGPQGARRLSELPPGGGADGAGSTARSTEEEGWVQANSPIQAVAVSPRLPRALQGAEGALAFASLDQLRLRPLPGAPNGPTGRAQAQAAFEAMYGAVTEEPASPATGGARRAEHPIDQEPVATSGKEAFAALELLEKKLGKNAPPADAQYPGGPIANSLRQLAQLIKADVGLRVGCADAGGWDTHAGQPGQLANNLRQLGDSVAAFIKDLGPHAADVALIAATEFGRTVRQNGALGTDHGHGSVAFVVGGGVRGGRIHGRWPGLRDDQLYEGRDLAVTTDLRSVLAAAAASQLGAVHVDALFPGFTGPALDGLFV